MMRRRARKATTRTIARMSALSNQVEKNVARDQAHVLRERLPPLLALQRSLRVKLPLLAMAGSVTKT
jgi:hypothetical protein